MLKHHSSELLHFLLFWLIQRENGCYLKIQWQVSVHRSLKSCKVTVHLYEKDFAFLTKGVFFFFFLIQCFKWILLTLITRAVGGFFRKMTALWYPVQADWEWFFKGVFLGASGAHVVLNTVDGHCTDSMQFLMSSVGLTVWGVFMWNVVILKMICK